MANSEDNNTEKLVINADKPNHGQWISKEYEPGLVSVIIPTYNEKDNIAPLLSRVAQALADYNYEIIIVDDGSKEDSHLLVYLFFMQIAEINQIIPPIIKKAYIPFRISWISARTLDQSTLTSRPKGM